MRESPKEEESGGKMATKTWTQLAYLERHLKKMNGTSQIKRPMRAKRKCPWQMGFVCTL